MKNVKRIMAIVGIVLLLGLYIVTFIVAVAGGEGTGQLFTACIVATVVIPVLIYVYTWIYKLVKKDADEARQKMYGQEEDEGE